MENCEPKVKKQKTVILNPILETFLGTNDKSKLERALKALEYGILAHNLNPDSDEVKPSGGFVGDIFLHGIEVLDKYLDKDHRQVPGEDQKREALQKLLIFLTSKKDHEIIIEEKDDDAAWSVTLAQHLLSKLAVHSNYTISSHSEFALLGEASCLRKEGDRLVVRIGDTSFGCKRGWHGEADIIMEDGVTLSKLQDQLEGEEQSEFSTEQHFCAADITLIMSQTVVSSFLQRKKNEKGLNNYLIPGIGIGAKSVFVCFYDSENDVLLQCRPINLFDGGSLSTVAVMFLWLVLNYRLFCSGVTEKMKGCKADFIKGLGDKANIYLEDVDRPVHVNTQDTEEELFSWAPPRVLPETRKLPGQKFIDF